MITSLKEFVGNYLNQYQISGGLKDFICHLCLLVGALMVAWLLGYICRKLVAPVVLKLVRKTQTVWDDYLLNAQLVRGICRVVPGVAFFIIAPFCLPVNFPFFSSVVVQLSKIYIVITCISLVVVMLNNIETFTMEEEKLREKHLYGIIEFLKMLTYFIGGIIIFAFLLGQNPLSMVAGIGAAATILMLVFKDSILGLVAGIQLSTNKMIKPGDWITIEKSNIDGVVEKVSLTTVKVRNFDNTISTVPPYSLISESFQNWASIDLGGGRRFKRALFIDLNSIKSCDTALLQLLSEKGLMKNADNVSPTGTINLSLYRKYIEDYLNGLPFVIKEKTILVRQLAPTAQGLPLEFYFFLNVTSFKPYEKLCADCMEEFIARLADFDLRAFQQPSGRDVEGLIHGSDNHQ